MTLTGSKANDIGVKTLIPRPPCDAHDHDQQLLADIVVTSVVVGSSPY